MTSSNHPTDDLLNSYAAGSLDLSQALPVSAHLEYCAHCRDNLQQFNQLGSELLQQISPAPASEQLKQQVLDCLDHLDEKKSSPAIDPESVTVPRCLRQFIPSSYDNLDWKRVSLSIESAKLCREPNGTRVELLRIRPGGRATTHTHLGDEYTVVLEGSFSDEDGLYRQGDFILRDRQHRHTPLASSDQVCICLVVTEGPAQFTGLFSRLFNPLMRRGFSSPR